jgi:hypothetical protein
VSFTILIAEQISAHHSHLIVLAISLPMASETSQYNFKHFDPDADWIQYAREEAAINRELEIRLGSQAKGLVLTEHGPNVDALVDILLTSMYNFLNSVIPTLWPSDVTKAAETVIGTGLPVLSQSGDIH